MNRIRQAWEDWTFWPRFICFVLKWLGVALFCDALIPDREYSITRRLFSDLHYRMSKALGVPFRDIDPVWPGIKACFKAYAQARAGARDYKRLERSLRPLIERYGEPGETIAEFIERLDRLEERAQIGELARQEREQWQSDGKTDRHGLKPAQ